MSCCACKALLAAVAILIVQVSATPVRSEDTVEALHTRVEDLHKTGKYAEAVPIAQRAIALAEHQSGPDHPTVAQSLEKLAVLYYRQVRYADAESLHRRSLAIRERALGPDHPHVGTTLNNLAVLLHSQGRYEDAELLFKRALGIRERLEGREHQDAGTTLNNLGVLYSVVGRSAEAELSYQRSLAIREKVLGPEDAAVGESLNNLAMLYESQGRYTDAERLLVRAFAIRQKVMGPVHQRTSFGPAHQDFVVTSNNVGALLYTQGRYAEAEQIFKAITVLLEAMLGPHHVSVGTAINNTAEVYRAQSRYADAEPLLMRALAIWEKALGVEHALVAVALDNLASLYQGQGHYADAEQLYKRSFAIRETSLDADHPEVSRSLNNLAVLAFAQHDWMGAVGFWRRSTSMITQRIRRGAQDAAKPHSAGRTKTEAERSSYQFWSLVKAVHRLDTPERNATHLRETFQAAQWAIASEAAQALAQMAARGAKGDPGLRALVRERQDLVEEWQHRDRARNTAVAQEPDRRDRAAEGANTVRLGVIDDRITRIDKQLTANFPDYAALAMPVPLTVEEVQGQLGADEALMLFLDTPRLQPIHEETFIWVVTKTAVRWVRSDLGSAALAREVQALRCGLDAAAWDSPSGPSCSDVLNLRNGLPAPTQLPFDQARAHALYKALFGEVEDQIHDKHLLIVPSGALTQVPLQVLITSPASGDHGSAAWLIRKHALTILPAVSSLQALRRDAKASRAAKPYFGIGNPLLDGPDSRYARLAKEAREKQACTSIASPKLARLSSTRETVRQLANRNGLVDIAHVRVQTPLPETRVELCAVARHLNAGAENIHLGDRGSEAILKRLSERGALADYRVLHFATHGALSGEIRGGTEPGLILTPPTAATAEDDGYLSASEIAALKLDADLVILSACNTAAGGAENAEALSGLARAFFYAGARALLVSHWAVYSDATVKIITEALSVLAADPSVGRAEALRRSMMTLIDKGAPHESHPAYWAPFVAVGEGSAR